MKNNRFTNKKNRILIRFAILFTTLIVSHISYSCFKEKNIPPIYKSNIPLVDNSKKNNTPPVYCEIPDANFRAYLKTIVPLAFTPDNKFISNHPSVISYNERMSIINKSIISLSGIECFTSLTELVCFDNKLTILDVSKNTALTKLYCSNNQLTTLDISKNQVLTTLVCDHNQLTTLDVSKNTNLTLLDCYWNQLKTLTIGENKVLRKIFCTYNRLIVLDVQNDIALIELHCYRNPLTTLIINPNSNSLKLYIDNSIKCCHPSIKAFKDRGGNLFDSYFHEIPPFNCP